jgi:hypothetical protein
MDGLDRSSLIELDTPTARGTPSDDKALAITVLGVALVQMRSFEPEHQAQAIRFGFYSVLFSAHEHCIPSLASPARSSPTPEAVSPLG